MSSMNPSGPADRSEDSEDHEILQGRTPPRLTADFFVDQEGMIREREEIESRHDPETIEGVFEILRTGESSTEGNWSRRFKGNIERLQSGDIFQVAEVVRDLTVRDREKGLSAGEKRMLQRSRQILISELISALHYDEGRAILLIDEALEEDRGPESREHVATSPVTAADRKDVNRSDQIPNRGREMPDVTAHAGYPLPSQDEISQEQQADRTARQRRSRVRNWVRRSGLASPEQKKVEAMRRFIADTSPSDTPSPVLRAYLHAKSEPMSREEATERTHRLKSELEELWDRTHSS
jgi:hypothetical protein